MSPQIKLLRMSRTGQKTPSLPAEPFDWSTGNLFGNPQEEWTAVFEISNPKGSGVLLAEGEVDVEYLATNVGWTNAVSKVLFTTLRDLPPYASATYQIETKRVQALIPSGTGGCRLGLSIRHPTAEERCRAWLARTGLWRRFPRVSAWFSGRLPHTKHWRAWRPEIELPRAHIEQDLQKERPLAEAGWHAPLAP